MNIDLESLGLTPEKLTELVVDRLVDEVSSYEDHNFIESLHAAAKERRQVAIDAAVQRVAQEHLVPRVQEAIDGVTLRLTNQWGEAKGAALTFREYLVQRAEAWMQEEVDYLGRTRSEAGGLSFRKHGTRIAHLVDKHLQSQIESAMKDALAEINSTIAKGLHETCRIAINEAAAKFKVVARS